MILLSVNYGSTQDQIACYAYRCTAVLQLKSKKSCAKQQAAPHRGVKTYHMMQGEVQVPVLYIFDSMRTQAGTRRPKDEAGEDSIAWKIKRCCAVTIGSYSPHRSQEWTRSSHWPPLFSCSWEEAGLCPLPDMHKHKPFVAASHQTICSG